MAATAASTEGSKKKKGADVDISDPNTLSQLKQMMQAEVMRLTIQGVAVHAADNCFDLCLASHTSDPNAKMDEEKMLCMDACGNKFAEAHAEVLESYTKFFEEAAKSVQERVDKGEISEEEVGLRRKRSGSASSEGKTGETDAEGESGAEEDDDDDDDDDDE